MPTSKARGNIFHTKINKSNKRRFDVVGMSLSSNYLGLFVHYKSTHLLDNDFPTMSKCRLLHSLICVLKINCCNPQPLNWNCCNGFVNRDDFFLPCIKNN